MISSGDLSRRNDFLAHGDDAGHFAPDCFGVFDFQRAGAAPAGANAAGCGASGKNQNHVFAQAGDLRFDLRFGAVADPDHGDDRADADDDAQRGQHRAHLVSAQRAEGDVKCGSDVACLR